MERVGVESVIYDVAVVGLGGMGSAALAHCAARGVRAIGIEQFDPVHDLGASSGKTRIIRQAYFEDPAYVPLLLRAYELWRSLEARSGYDLLRITGLLMAGGEQSDVIAGSTQAARTYDLPVDYLTAGDMRKRYPALRVSDGEVGVYEREGGAVFPERAIRAHLDLAADSGAQTRFGVAMRSWKSASSHVTLDLTDGTQVHARSLILTMGPWFASAMREAGVAIEVQRNVQLWFDPESRDYDAGAFPAFLIERDGLPAPLYGFPDFGDGVKAAFHGFGAVTTPQDLDRGIDPVRDVKLLADALESWMPGAAGRLREGKVCMYALTPDRHFVIDRDPRDARVILCGGFSGHGYKFAAVVGEIASQLVIDGGTAHDIAFLSLRRFAQ